MLFSAEVNAQAGNPPDTSKAKVPADTAIHLPSVPVPLKGATSAMGTKLNAPDPSVQLNKIKNTVTDQKSQYTTAAKNKLSTIKPSPFSYNLVLGNTALYQPVPFTGISYNHRYVDAFTVSGSVRAWVVPLNFNYSTNRAVSNTAALNNSLFKFDFNSKLFAEMYQSDMQQYEDLRKNSFSGLSLTAYTHNIVARQLSQQEQNLPGSASDPLLLKYLNDPKHVNELLSMSQEQIHDKLLKEVSSNQTEAERLVKTNMSSATGVSAGQSLNEAALKNSVLQNISKNQGIANYLNDPVNTSEIGLKTPEQIESRLTDLAAKNQATNYQAFKSGTIIPADFVDLGPLIQKVTTAEQAAQQESLHKIAIASFVSSRQGLTPQLDQMVNMQQQQINTQSSVIKAGMINKATAVSTVNPGQVSLNRNVDSVASAITSLKKQLNAGGYDVQKLLKMQQLLDAGNGNPGTSEAAVELMNKKPATALQSALGNVQSFKLGAFGGQAPGTTNGQDLFMTGTSLTYKAEGIPITAGYGTTNDIGSLKDANFQTSVYDPPKSLTFLGAQINRGVFGKVKVSFSSSLNRELANNAYSISTISNNTMALTVSKDLTIHSLGDFTFDASKSASLNNNSYQAGIQPILDRQAGLNNNLSTDLFQSVSFGASQHLDFPGMEMSDNIYFSYAGMGYQNPGNTGYGGARMKLGGNLKKAFYKRKLVLTLRSDLNDMPISYTSNDKWKNTQVSLDSRYVISKKFNVSLKYSTNNTGKTVDNLYTPVYSFQKLQIDGNASYKLGKYFSVSHLTVGQQNFSNTFQSQSAGNLLMVNYTQSVLIERNTITANIFYNKELSAFQLIGNMLTSDVSCSYILFEKFNLSSGITYLDNTGIAKQAGIKQSLQLFSVKSFSLDSYFNYSKNLITPLYPELYSNCRAALSLKYHLKK